MSELEILKFWLRIDFLDRFPILNYYKIRGNKVPKKKLKSYKTILKKSGIGKKETITK